MRSNAADFDDRLGYGASPPAGYAAALVAAMFIFIIRPSARRYWPAP